MRVEYAELSLKGGRETNQDRISVAVAQDCALLIACDGMGGHAEGERAAEVAQRTIVERFWHTPQPLMDPLGFLHLSMGAAHVGVVTLGLPLSLELRPRSTCAMCLVQQSSAYWAHVGDSRVYHLRDGRVLERTRDHSHVELLVREGLLNPDQTQNHPLRNFVESCLGGEPMVPEMAINGRRALRHNDVLIVCTDGLWASLDEAAIASAFGAPDTPLRDTIAALSSQAVLVAGALSDNTSIAALRFLE